MIPFHSITSLSAYQAGRFDLIVAEEGLRLAAYRDTYVVDSISDIVIESAAGGTDSVLSSITYALGADVENLTLTGAAISAIGNNLNNSLVGNAQANTLDGGVGADTMSGGTGDDTYIVDDAGDVVIESAGAGTDSVESSVTYALGAEVENLTLTDTAISGTGNGLNNSLSGNAQANTLDGGLGADTMSGGAGDDTYVVDDAGDSVIEGAGGGTDTVQSSITYSLGAEVENLTLTGTATSATGNSLNNSLIGNAQANALDGGAGADTMSGGAGDDTYVVDNTGDSVIEGAGGGTDTVQSSMTYTLGSELENLTLIGNAAINGTGNALANELRGNSAANTLAGGLGNDSYYVGTGDTVTEAASAGTDTVFADFTYTLGNNVENLTLLGSANINGTGNSLANILRGNSGINTLAGGTGDDQYYVSTGDTVTEASNAGTDTVFSDVTWTLGTNIEKLTLLGAANINATGNTLANTLTGNAGNNILTGGSGADTMIGGAGSDTYMVDSTSDAITELLNEGIDTVQSSVTYTLAANVENLTLTGTTALGGTGNALDNVLTGNSGNNALNGMGGNDTYFLTSGDTVTEAAGGGEDLVNVGATHTLATNVENLILAGTTAINGTGNASNNLLRGNSAVNTLAGAAGNDVLEGGDGNDILGDTGGKNLLNGQGGTDTLNGNTGNELLIGGAGNDTVNTNSGADIIAFNRGDGADTVAVSTAKDNSLSLGGGIAYADLFFQKSGTNLVLKTAGSAGAEQLTFTNWYSAAANRSVLTLQMIVEASADFDAGSADPLKNKKVARFNFDNLVSQFDAALVVNPGLTSWALTNALSTFHLGGSDTQALGGDLTYRYGLQGNLAAVGSTGAQNVLGDAQFGSGIQTFQTQTALESGMMRLT